MTPQQDYVPQDRRPIHARAWPVFQHLATLLAHRNISANSISVVGMACAIAAGLLLAFMPHDGLGQRFSWLIAAVLMQLRLIANLLDGMVAIESRTASPVGELYNEVPDRISDAAIFIGAGYAPGSQIELGYLAACLAIFTAYVRATGKAAGASQDYCGPMAKPQRMALMTAICLYLALTPHAWQPEWRDLGLISAALILIIAGCILTSCRRLLRISSNLKAGSNAS